MRSFKQAFWGGYKKEEVDEYIEHLMEELENLKTQRTGTEVGDAEEIKLLTDQLSAEQNERKLLEEEKKELEMQMQEMEHQRSLLEEQVDELQRKQQETENETSEQFAALKEKLNDYEEHYVSFSRVFAIAEKDAEKMKAEGRVEADRTIQEAKTEAEKTVGIARAEAMEIVSSARAEADDYRRATEQELKKKRKKNEDDFMLAKYKLMEYLKALNETQNQLLETYEGLGQLVERLPLRIGDVLSDEPFGLLNNDDAIEKGNSEESEDKKDNGI